jgi:hypothetical protein
MLTDQALLNEKKKWKEIIGFRSEEGDKDPRVLMLYTTAKSILLEGLKKCNENGILVWVRTIWWTIIHSEESEGDLSLREQAIMMKDINSYLMKYDEFVQTKAYWNLVNKFLVSSDSFLRKWGVLILKQNLAWTQFEDEIMNTMWETFFDLYDTLEGFVSHLIKVS